MTRTEIQISTQEKDENIPSLRSSPFQWSLDPQVGSRPPTAMVLKLGARSIGLRQRVSTLVLSEERTTAKSGRTEREKAVDFKSQLCQLATKP